jgi:hypothetical protein
MPKVFSEAVARLGVWAAAGTQANTVAKAHEAFNETEADNE